MMKREYQIVESEQPGIGPQLRGGAAELWKFTGPEAILSGPAETGKTFGSLYKLDAFLWHFPGAQGVLCRKVRDTIYPTVLQTYIHKILGKGSPVKAYGGERAVHFTYPNGSRLWIAGMDDPGKALSSERDVICVNQAEELDGDDWEVLTTRATGRAGNAPYGQVFGDCNPWNPSHWIKKRSQAGSLKLFESRHEDNPTLWDEEREAWTRQGLNTLAVLDALTGVRKERLRYGRWVQAEGQVYEGWSDSLHLIDPFPIPVSWARYWSIDFGYTNPFVCQFWAVDPDGRLYMYREIYLSQRIVEDHAKRILKVVGATRDDGGPDWSINCEPRPRAIICDHDAEDRATLERHLKGMMTKSARKDISPGIQAVASRLRKAGDGKPRLFIFRNALDQRDSEMAAKKKPMSTVEEIESYVWDVNSGRKKGDELPVDKDNHGMDAMRYMVYHLDGKPAQSATNGFKGGVLRAGAR